MQLVSAPQLMLFPSRCPSSSVFSSPSLRGQSGDVTLTLSPRSLGPGHHVLGLRFQYLSITPQLSKGVAKVLRSPVLKKKTKKKTKKQKPTFFPQKGQKYDKQILKMNEGTPQDGRGVGGHGVHLSPWRHQEYTFRHRRSCRTLAESGQGSLTTGKEYIYIHARLGRTKEGGGKEEDEQLGLRPGTGELRVQVSVAQLDLALCNSMDCSPPGSCVHVIFQAAILGWVAIPFCRGSPQPKD